MTDMNMKEPTIQELRQRFGVSDEEYAEKRALVIDSFNKIMEHESKYSHAMIGMILTFCRWLNENKMTALVMGLLYLEQKRCSAPTDSQIG